MVRVLSLLAGTVLAIVMALPAAAGSPHIVDPATMSPPLNPAFAPWTCTATGAGSTCRGVASFSWVAEDTGLACGGRPIYTTGSATTVGTRWGQADGSATDSAFHSEADETWSLSPDGASPTIEVRARFNEAFHYGVAGDVATRTYRLTGGYYQVTAPGIGVVWHDAGYAFTGAGPDAETVLHGPHDSDLGFLDEVVPAACAALGA